MDKFDLSVDEISISLSFQNLMEKYSDTALPVKDIFALSQSTIHKMALFLDFKEILHLCITNQYFQAITSSSVIWETLFQREIMRTGRLKRFPVLEISISKENFLQSLKQFWCEVCQNNLQYPCPPTVRDGPSIILRCPCVLRRWPAGHKPALTVASFGANRSTYNQGENSFCTSPLYTNARQTLDQYFDTTYVPLDRLEEESLSTTDLLILDTWSASRLDPEEQDALRTFLSSKMKGTAVVNLFGSWSNDGDNSKSIGEVFGIKPQGMLAYLPDEFQSQPGWESTKKLCFYGRGESALLRGPFGKVGHFSNRVQTTCSPGDVTVSEEYLPLSVMPCKDGARTRSSSLGEFIRLQRKGNKKERMNETKRTAAELKALQSQDFVLSFLPRTNTLFPAADTGAAGASGQALLCTNQHWMADPIAWNGGLFPNPSENFSEVDPRWSNMYLFLNLAALSIMQ